MGRFIALGVAAILVVADQLIKLWAVANLESRITVISGLFYLTYVENRGAAFGIMQDKTILLAVISLIVLFAALLAVLAGYVKDKFLIWSISLVLAGGFGNCIDRVFRGFVVDYLDFSALFNFPVFNLADCCVVAGTGLILFYILVIERRRDNEKKLRDEAAGPKQDDDDPAEEPPMKHSEELEEQP